MKTITANRDQISAAFEEWKRRADADPDDFEGGEEDAYGDDCADFLIELLEDLDSEVVEISDEDPAS